MVFSHNTLKKKWVIELTFLIQISIQTCNKLILWWSSISKFPKIASLPCFYNISKKKLAMKLIFLHADTHQSFLRADFNIVTRWSSNYWWEWSSILKVLMQHFRNIFSAISKKSCEWSSSFSCRSISTLLQVGIIILDGSGHIYQKWPK